MLIWGLTDGSAGMVSQVRGVGEMLAAKTNGRFELKRARRIWPLCLLPGTCWRGSRYLKTWDSDALKAPWPDVLITSGRRSVAFALAIKHASGGSTRLVHLQTPRVPLELFDLVVPMEHDDVSGENIFPTFAGLHHINQQKLSQAVYDFSDKLSSYPKPVTAFFIGGSTNKYRLTQKRMAQLLDKLKQFSKSSEGSIWVSTSRRTGKDNIAQLQRSIEAGKFGDTPVWLYHGQGNNPYLAWLGSADRLVVTNDSVSMMSEALATGRPVYILNLPQHEGTKPAKFARQLISRGMAMPFSMPLIPYNAEPYSECEAVVDELMQLLK